MTTQGNPLHGYSPEETGQIHAMVFKLMTPEQQQQYMLLQAYVANNAVDLPGILKRLDNTEAAIVMLTEQVDSLTNPNGTQPDNTGPESDTIPSETAASGVMSAGDSAEVTQPTQQPDPAPTAPEVAPPTTPPIDVPLPPPVQPEVAASTADVALTPDAATVTAADSTQDEPPPF